MASRPISNPPQRLTMNNIRSVMGDPRHKGLAKTARFLVRISPEGNPENHLLRGAMGPNGILEDLQYLCESSEFPSKGFMNADVRFYGPNEKFPFQTQFDDITMTFLCRSEFYEREFFDDWMSAINPSNSFNFNYRQDYSCKIELFQLAEYSLNEGEFTSRTDPPKATYKFTLHEAWPVNISPMPLVWSDDNFQRMAVTFTFFKWTREGEPQPTRGGALQGSDV
jgi:hypothetical protein